MQRNWALGRASWQLRKEIIRKREIMEKKICVEKKHDFSSAVRARTRWHHFGMFGQRHFAKIRMIEGLLRSQALGGIVAEQAWV